MSQPKSRHQSTYDKKIKRIRAWYAHLEKERNNAKGDSLINPNTKKEPIRAELKPVDWYIDKLKKPNAVKGGK